MCMLWRGGNDWTNSFDIAVVEGSHVNNLIKVIVEYLFLYGGLSESNLVLELVCFGADNVCRNPTLG